MQHFHTARGLGMAGMSHQYRPVPKSHRSQSHGIPRGAVDNQEALRGVRSAGCHETSVCGGLQLALDQSQWIPGCGGWNICAPSGGWAAAGTSGAGPTQEYWKNSCKLRDSFIPVDCGVVSGHSKGLSSCPIPGLWSWKCPPASQSTGGFLQGSKHLPTKLLDISLSLLARITLKIIKNMENPMLHPLSCHNKSAEPLVPQQPQLSLQQMIAGLCLHFLQHLRGCSHWKSHRATISWGNFFTHFVVSAITFPQVVLSFLQLPNEGYNINTEGR